MFGQLVEYSMRKNFLEKSCTKCGGETSPRPFFIKSKLSTCVLSLFFYKVAGLGTATFLKHRCFLMNFVKFLRTPFLYNTSGGCFFCLLREQVNVIKNAYSGLLFF